MDTESPVKALLSPYLPLERPLLSTPGPRNSYTLPGIEKSKIFEHLQIVFVSSGALSETKTEQLHMFILDSLHDFYDWASLKAEPTTHNALQQSENQIAQPGSQVLLLEISLEAWS